VTYIADFAARLREENPDEIADFIRSMGRHELHAAG